MTFGVTTNLKIGQAPDPSKAPHYGEEFRAVNIDRALIVHNGTETGQPTVDITLVDEKGNQYITMISGALLVGLAVMIQDAQRLKNGQVLRH